MITRAFDPKARISFDDATHRYVLDGSKELISVTTAIGIAFAGMLGEQYYTEESRQRGQAVHKAIMLEAEHDLDERTVHPIVRPYFEAYRKFADAERPEWLHTEAVVFDETYGYAGTLDALGFFTGPNRARVPGFNVVDLPDWKSGTLPWTVGMQTAAYRRCIIGSLPPKTIVRRWALRLCDDASYQLEKVSEWADHRSHESDFLAALTVAKLRRRYHYEKKTPV